jgi:hypothetical protein
MVWFAVVGGDDRLPMDWNAQELHNSADDLMKLARKVINELDDRYTNSFSDLNQMLSKCFNFARLFVGLCGKRT